MTLAELTSLDRESLAAELKKCCGSDKWVQDVIAGFPYNSKGKLFEAADKAWAKCTEEDFLQAFTGHPRIGDTSNMYQQFKSTASWAREEQAGMAGKTKEVLESLAECNRLYEEKFNYIFIINATGKEAEEILGTIRWRLLNTPEDEIQIAAEEQHAITQIRLKKLLS